MSLLDDWKAATPVCPLCQGAGTVLRPSFVAHGPDMPRWCDACKSKGVIVDKDAQIKVLAKALREAVDDVIAADDSEVWNSIRAILADLEKEHG